MKKEIRQTLLWFILAAALVLLALVLRFAAHIYTPAYAVGILGVVAGYVALWKARRNWVAVSAALAAAALILALPCAVTPTGAICVCSSRR